MEEEDEEKKEEEEEGGSPTVLYPGYGEGMKRHTESLGVRNGKCIIGCCIN